MIARRVRKVEEFHTKQQQDEKRISLARSFEYIPIGIEAFTRPIDENIQFLAIL